MARLAVAVALALGWGLALAAPVAGTRLAETPHNLSASSRGAVRASAVGELCVFCHTPHSAVPKRALWNRDLPPITYKLYTSSTLQAAPLQPTGTSRLCLSCHDGTTALGALRVRPGPGRRPVALGPLTGRASLGTDLSDDHPISFVYDADLARKQGQLADPAGLPRTLPLDSTRQLQCTTCHDPHENRNRKFLRVDDRGGALCTACHAPKGWPGSSHARSPATWNGNGVNPWPTSPYTKVADNACGNCHRSHAAPRPARLLGQARERDVCLVCHGGGVAAKNLAGELAKPTVHPVGASDWTHDPREDPSAMPRHVTCVDCHSPHQATAGQATRPAVPGPLRGVRGVNLAGVAVSEASQEYEVCLKCHGLRDQTTPGIVRQDNTRNVRLQIDPANASYHPLAAPGRNPGMGGFEPGYSASSVVSCTDCHNNDEWTPAGSKPRGPHGSRYPGLLEREYQASDPAPESFQSYALCYKCHNRDALLGNRAAGFPHAGHVVGAEASCAVCHAAHGSRQAPRLVNFMLRDRSGRTVVAPSRVEARLEYLSPKPGGGPGSGQCYLSCHGKNHEPESYPPGARPAGRLTGSWPGAPAGSGSRSAGRPP